jgi:hypothetical protein
MYDGFIGRLFEKKNQGGCSDSPYHHPERKRRNASKFTRKKNLI